MPDLSCENRNVIELKSGQIWGIDGDRFCVDSGGRFVFGAVVDGGFEVLDFGGAFVLPGFVDAHCHVLPSGLDLLKLNLSGCGTREEVLEAVRDWERGMEPGEDWLQATQYDQTKFPGARHIEKGELDAISTSRPILLRHSNGHASVCNSAALALAGVTGATADPEGGTYVRDAGGEATGVLLEKAHEYVTGCVPTPSLEQMVEAILRAGDSMSGYGITCATDMMTGRFDLAREMEAYRLASERGCKVRLRLCVQWATVLGSKGVGAEGLAELAAGMDPDLCKVIGLKVFADGAIGSATAAIHSTFVTTGGNGQLIYPEEVLAEIVAKIDAAGFGCSVHTIGDRSTDLVVEAYEKTDDPGRHRIEHAMILSDAQIERLARLGSHVTLQPEFLYRFGHAYRAQIPDLAPSLIRARSLIDAGVEVSFNSDRPIVPGDPWTGIRAAVDRPAGFDGSEAVTLEEGVEAYTFGGALANGDSEFLGRIGEGLAADFQVRRGGWDGELVGVWLGGRRVLG